MSDVELRVVAVPFVGVTKSREPTVEDGNLEAAAKRLENWFQYMIHHPQMSGDEYDKNMETAARIGVAAWLGVSDE